MGLLNIIRRMHLRQKLSIREIARLTGVSRNTVTKHLAANTIEPKFATPDRQSKIDPFAEKLAGWLKTEAGKSRKQKRTMKQLHADLVVLGFTGSYARVPAPARPEAWPFAPIAGPPHWSAQRGSSLLWLGVFRSYVEARRRYSTARLTRFVSRTT